MGRRVSYCNGQEEPLKFTDSHVCTLMGKNKNMLIIDYDK